MINAKETLSKIAKYEQAKALSSETEKEMSLAMSKIENESRSVINQVISGINRNDFKPYFNNMLQIHSDKLVFDPGKARIIYRGSSPAVQPLPENFVNLIVQAWNTMTKIPDPASEAAAKSLATGFNTCMAVIEARETLIDDAKKLTARKIKNQISEFDSVIKDFERSDIFTEKNCRKHVENDYREGHIVIGRMADGLTSDEIEKLKEYGYEENDFSEEIALECSKEGNAAFIHVPKDCGQGGKGAVFKYLQSVFYNNFMSCAPGDFAIATIEKSGTGSNPLQNLVFSLKEVSEKEPMFSDCAYKVLNKRTDESNISGTVINDIDAVLLVESIKDEIENYRVNIIGSESRPDIKTINDYNRINKFNTIKHILVIIHGLPDKFITDEYNGDLGRKFTDALDYLLGSGDRGVYVLMVGENERVKRDYDNNDPWMIGANANHRHIRMIEFDDPRFIRPAPVSDDERERKQEDEIKRARYYGTLGLGKLIEVSKETGFERPELGSEICIPVGLSAGKPYVFATKVAGGKMGGGVNTLVLGATGRGKSAFIRLLVLSGAAYYSPEELQFYILDFKSETATADFQCFRQSEDKNLYVPHVKFLSLKSGPRHGIEVLKMIRKTINDRLSLFSRIKGCSDFKLYCELQRNDSSGKLPKLPQIYVLIDEYNSIFTDREIALCEELNNCLQKVRTAGISIILSGQMHATGNIDENALQNRIIFDVNDPRIFSKSFADTDDNQKNNTSQMYSSVSGKVGIAACAREVSTDKKEAVKMAFVDTEGESAEIAEKIRQKYKDLNQKMIQIVPGNEEAESADSILKLSDGEIEVNVEKAYAFYVGLSSLISMPVALKFGRKENDLENDTESIYYSNYLARLGEKAQEKLELNAMMSYLSFLKSNGTDPGTYHISYNYEPEESEIKNHIPDIVAEHRIGDEIHVNDRLARILDEIERLYEVYTLRKKKKTNAEDDGLPQFMVIHNATWIPEFRSRIQDIEDEDEEEFQYEAAEFEEFDVGDDAKNEALRLALAEDPELAALLREQLLDDANINSVKGQKKSSFSGDTLTHLEEMMRNGNRYNIFILICATTFDGFDSFIKVRDWEAKVSLNMRDNKGNLLGKGGENVCYIDGTEVRLFDYGNAPKWWEAFEKMRGENNDNGK